MDSKNILTTVVVAALVTIVVSLGMNALQLSPIFGSAAPVGSYQPTGFVNANECTKDGVCEVNALVSTSDQGSIFEGPLNANGGFYMPYGLNNILDIASTDGGALFVSTSTGKVGVGTSNPEIKFHVVGDSIIDGAFNARQGVYVQNGPVDVVGGYIRSSDLIGNGTVKVCVDSTGKLKRC